MKLAASLVLAVAFALCGQAASAKGDPSLFYPDPIHGPPGTVVPLPPEPIECSGQLRLLPYLNKSGSPPADRTAGDPVDTSRGVIVIPDAEPGEYQMLFLCGTEVVAGFFFWIDAGAAPAFTG